MIITCYELFGCYIFMEITHCVVTVVEFSSNLFFILEMLIDNVEVGNGWATVGYTLLREGSVVGFRWGE